jgi:hypothetical protein
MNDRNSGLGQRFQVVHGIFLYSRASASSLNP